MELELRKCFACAEAEVGEEGGVVLGGPGNGGLRCGRRGCGGYGHGLAESGCGEEECGRDGKTGNAWVHWALRELGIEDSLVVAIRKAVKELQTRPSTGLREATLGNNSLRE